MPAALRRTLIVLLTVAAALALFAPPASARAVGTAADEAGFVSRINAARSAAGLPAYSVSGDLATVARRHAQRMADRGEHYHNPNLANEVVAGWLMLGENVGRGPEVESLHRAFMESPAHRANILRREFTQVGIGVVRDASGLIYVVEVFRQPGQAAAPAPTPAPKPAVAPAPKPAPKPAPAPTPKPAPQPAPTTTVPATRPTVAPVDTVAALGAPMEPVGSPVLASVTTAANPSVTGPATVAALLIAGLLAAMAGARRQLVGLG